MTLPGLGFLGTSTHSVDKKNRVFVAKRFQDVLPRDEEGNRTAVLNAGTGGCIWMTTHEGFSALAKRFEGNPLDPDSQVDDERDFYAHVAEVTLDSSGRVLLPAELRELCGIGEEVVMIGMRSRVEIWSTEGWARRQRGTLAARQLAAPREGAN
ncbi:MAG: hypothetical protein R3F49_03260 [Planctomycetota bacterium]